MSISKFSGVRDFRRSFRMNPAVENNLSTSTDQSVEWSGGAEKYFFIKGRRSSKSVEFSFHHNVAIDPSGILGSL